MEADFRELLSSRKVKEVVILKLETEDIETIEEFKSLKKEELRLFLEKGVSVGQFSKLSILWDSLQDDRRDRPTCRSPSPLRKTASDFTGDIIYVDTFLNFTSNTCTCRSSDKTGFI